MTNSKREYQNKKKTKTKTKETKIEEENGAHIFKLKEAKVAEIGDRAVS
jgi:hypothetical protein